MATKKAPIKKDSFIWEVLAATDTNCKSAWDDFTDAERKNVSLYTLNRWLSSVSGSVTSIEDQLISVNELYNKDLFSIMSKHPKLTWMTACACNADGNIQKHNWIKVGKTSSKCRNDLVQRYIRYRPENRKDTLSKICEIIFSQAHVRSTFRKKEKNQRFIINSCFGR